MVNQSSGKEGKVFLAWCRARLFRRNQNVIAVTTGGTGSGKSMQDLRRMELHYKEFFSKKFPDTNKRILQNVFFSIGEVVTRLASKDDPLLPGEQILLEEVGAVHSSHAWQDKSAKLFNYVLQSFRSRGIMLQMNLPVFTMLNKSARLLCHFHFVMTSIDYKNKMSVCKGKYLQLNQEMGRHYPKYLRSLVDGRYQKMQRFSYGLPCQELIDAYEKKKSAFVEKTIMDLKVYEDKRREKETDTLHGNGKPFTGQQQMVHDLYHKGIIKQEDIAKEIGVTQGYVSEIMSLMDKKYSIWRKIPRKTAISPFITN